MYEWKALAAPDATVRDGDEFSFKPVSQTASLRAREGASKREIGIIPQQQRQPQQQLVWALNWRKLSKLSKPNKPRKPYEQCCHGCAYNQPGRKSSR